MYFFISVETIKPVVAIPRACQYHCQFHATKKTFDLPPEFDKIHFRAATQVSLRIKVSIGIS